MKHYTGVGSRSTPKDIMKLIESVAFKLSQSGWVLRSGGAEGADTAFERGASNSFSENPPEIFLPWKDFNKRKGIDTSSLEYEALMEYAWGIAAQVHPNWAVCSAGAQALHGRNVFQVLGKDLNSPSKFLICWSEVDKEGIPRGGTRTAWVLAKQYEIPCFNLLFDEHKERVLKFANS